MYYSCDQLHGEERGGGSNPPRWNVQATTSEGSLLTHQFFGGGKIETRKPYLFISNPLLEFCINITYAHLLLFTFAPKDCTKCASTLNIGHFNVLASRQPVQYNLCSTSDGYNSDVASQGGDYSDSCEGYSPRSYRPSPPSYIGGGPGSGSNQ